MMLFMAPMPQAHSAPTSKSRNELDSGGDSDGYVSLRRERTDRNEHHSTSQAATGERANKWKREAASPKTW